MYFERTRIKCFAVIDRLFVFVRKFCLFYFVSLELNLLLTFYNRSAFCRTRFNFSNRGILKIKLSSLTSMQRYVDAEFLINGAPYRVKILYIPISFLRNPRFPFVVVKYFFVLFFVLKKLVPNSSTCNFLSDFTIM